MARIDVSDEDGTAELAHALASSVRAGDVVLLEGPLGAGKTTFVRYLARALGVPDDEPVISPSFAIVQEYEARIPLVHADLYRLAHVDELAELGLDERIGRDAFVVVEWGESHAHGLGRVDLLVRIAPHGDARTFVVESHSARGAEIERSLVASRAHR